MGICGIAALPEPADEWSEISTTSNKKPLYGGVVVNDIGMCWDESETSKSWNEKCGELTDHTHGTDYKRIRKYGGECPKCGKYAKSWACQPWCYKPEFDNNKIPWSTRCGWEQKDCTEMKKKFADGTAVVHVGGSTQEKDSNDFSDYICMQNCRGCKECPGAPGHEEYLQ